MNLFEEAVIYSTVMHTGMKRKFNNTPYILHPLEVAHIISTMTDDIEIIAAGVLHDVVEDTDGSMGEIRKRFGDRVADLVASETENKDLEWRERKENSLLMLKSSKDIGVKMLWLADKLSNMRSIARNYSENGSKIWETFHQKDPEKHRWYYKSIAEQLELELNRTGAFKEFLKHINFIWPGTFDSEKSRYKKYRELSVDGCPIIGKGAKGTVYRYDDELIVKVYNEKNIFKDIERENYLAKQAFIAGIPTAISFGIVAVGEKYGSMFELLNANTVSALIASNPENIDFYAKVMADLATIIHTTSGEKIDLPDYKDTIYTWINNGIAFEDKELTAKITKMVDDIPKVNTIIHGDFHTGNVMAQRDEFLLIDMDTLSTYHPIAELCGLYMAYVGFGELDHSFVENFLGFSYEKANEFFRLFMKHYLKTEDQNFINSVINKAALMTYVRLVRRCYKEGTKLSEKNAKARDYYMDKIYKLIKEVDSFTW